MRCTRCDGLAVPQAVGIAPSGKVVFGYCLQCLADTDCRLVEVTGRGPADLRLSFRLSEPTRQGPGGNIVPAGTIDQSRCIVGVVAFLMITWGYLILTAGLMMAPRPGTAPSALGNGTTGLLGIGGVVTALLGLALLIIATRQAAFPGLFLLTLLSWISFMTAVGMLILGILDYQPRRNLPLVLGVGLAILVSVISRRLERSQRDSRGFTGQSPSPKLLPSPGKSNADGLTPLL